MINYSAGYIKYVATAAVILAVSGYLVSNRIYTEETTDTVDKNTDTKELVEVTSATEETTNDSVSSTEECRGTISSQTTPSNLDSAAVEIAKKFVLDRLGKKYYTCNISLNPNNGGPENQWNKDNKNYLIYFTYTEPKTLSKVIIQIIVNTDTRQAKAGTTDGLPDCSSNPNECELVTTESKAISIALSSGSRTGATARFAYSIKNDAWVWNVTEKNSLPCPLLTTIIDTHTGKIVDTKVNPCTPPPTSN
jgi:hypothetical protein